jgi:uncharacterized protein (DUF1697 family)
VKVLLRDRDEIGAVVDAMPKTWRNDSDHKTDVYFSDRFDSADVIDEFPLTKGLEETRFAPGAVIVRIPRDRLTKSKITKIVGTDLYKEMTARNCNTARKIHEMLSELD